MQADASGSISVRDGPAGTVKDTTGIDPGALFQAGAVSSAAGTVLPADAQ